MKTFVLGCGLLAFAGAAFFVGEAGGWDLLATYATPGSDPRGCYHYNIDRCWIVNGGSQPHIYQYYWRTSRIVSSFPAPGGSGAWGIYRTSMDTLYISNNRTSVIYRVTTSGSVVSSYLCPIAGPADIGWDLVSPYLYVAIPNRNLIALVNRTTGSLVGTIAGPGSRPTGCGGYRGLFVTDSATHTVYLDGRPILTGIQTPVGFDDINTIGHDIGTAIFIPDDATDRVYIYDDWVTVVPASLGRVKALFR
ncbi:MAG: hypothetical protein JSU81_05820 [Candidatus Coatesbacteria bacterium]|nr:MAG: hypothetical protein JSU81_05820 [Candidatus Coatesbacteria bacterium]